MLLVRALFLGLSFLLLGACTRQSDKFFGNAEAYSGLRPKDGTYYWMDSRAVCQNNGASVTGYRGTITIEGDRPIKYRKACNTNYVYLQESDVAFLIFGDEKLAATERAVTFQGGIFDRQASAPQIGSTDRISTRVAYRFQVGTKTYDVAIRAKGSTENPVDAKAYILEVGTNNILPEVNVLSTTIGSSARSYLGTNFELAVSTASSGTTAQLKSTIESTSITSTSSEGADTFLAPPAVNETPIDLNLSAGPGFTCASRTGTAYCWGTNNEGQLGNGTTTEAHVPTPVSFPADLTSMVSAGRSTMACALYGGNVNCWGANNLGQLGRGFDSPRETTPVVVPLNLPTRVAAGNAFACAIADEKVYCWGNNTAGQLGQGNVIGYNSPQPVLGIPGIVVDIAVGMQHVCALTSVGDLYCWGSNTLGQLGQGTSGGQSSTVQKIENRKFVAVASYEYSSCAITDLGKLACWGNNAGGLATGDGVAGGNVLTPTDLPGLAGPVSTMALGLSHACAIQKGILYCWGSNIGGATANGATTGSSAVHSVDLGNEAATAVTCGTYHCLAKTVTGVKAWGRNSFGQLGNNSTTGATTPISVNIP